LNTSKLSQVLPSVRRVPRLPVEPELAERLTAIAEQAHEQASRNRPPRSEDEVVFEDGWRVGGAVVRAQSAAERYLSEKLSETPLPVFRKMVKGDRNGGALRKAIDTLVTQLPDSDDHPPFAQVRAHYCYGDPRANGNEAGTPEEIEQRQRREDQWTEQRSPMAMKAVLVDWQQRMDELSPLTGTGRTEISAERHFVDRLAHYWTDELGACLTLSRGERRQGGEDVRQSGLFPDFVRAAAEMIPREFRPHTFETAIEQIVGRKT
jgi:hypothetical protein